MVKLFFFISVILFTTVNAAPAAKKLRLTQKDVAELTLKQGNKAAEVNLQFMQNRLAPVQALSVFDWKADLQSGYEEDKMQTFSPPTLLGASYKRFRNVFGLSKQFSTGTLLGIDYNRLSQKADYTLSPLSAVTPAASVDGLLPALTQDIFDVTIEQSLLGNFMGRADRATVNAADLTFKAAEVDRTDGLQTSVLETIRAFWDGYVAQETFKEALASRDRYKRLVSQVKRKSDVGYANPGELPQAQAEYEGQEQSVKSKSTDYLAKLENLITLLNLPADTQIEFVVDDQIPPVPKIVPANVDDLRVIRAQKLRSEAANESLVAARSKSYPNVNLVGKYYTSGYDETSDGSLSAMTGNTHPQYYIGAHVSYNFGSGLQAEQIINAKVTKELTERQLMRQRLEQNDLLSQAERNVQSSYAVVQSAIRQKEFREKAARELNRTYTQGRTDIKLLIDAINDQFNTEVTLSRAIGDYQIALNVWAAARDELIPEIKEEK